MQTAFRQIPKFPAAVFPEEPAEETFMPRRNFKPWQIFIVLIFTGLVLAYFLSEGKSQKDYFDELSARKEAGEALASGEQKDYCELLFQFRDSVSEECVSCLDGINWKNAPSLPELLNEDWEELPTGKFSNTRKFRHKKYKQIQINFDYSNLDAPPKAHKSKNHWHRLNPNSRSKKDYYLDENGLPTPKGLKPSHIFPKK